MIIHLTGNLAAGKTTAAEIIGARLGWPVVGIGTFRAMQPPLTAEEAETGAAWEREDAAWEREDAAWQSLHERLLPCAVASMDPAVSLVLTTSGHNRREHIAWASISQRLTTRGWLRAPFPVLQARLNKVRGERVHAGFWPYGSSEAMLQDRLGIAEEVYGIRALTCPPDRRFWSNRVKPEQIAAAMIRCAQWKCWVARCFWKEGVAERAR